MVTRQRKTGLFVAGAAGGAVIVLAAWLALSGTGRMPWQPEAASQRYAQQSADAARPATAATTAAQAVPISVSSCPPQPAVAANGAQDGKFSLEKALDTVPLPSASAFLAVAREAAQQSRYRDAEVAFIAACRVAERQDGSHSTPVADAKSQLAEHYVAMAARATQEEAGHGLFQRATALLSESADAYSVALGKNASRSRSVRTRPRPGWPSAAWPPSGWGRRRKPQPTGRKASRRRTIPPCSAVRETRRRRTRRVPPRGS
jgi:hypothetical protein